MACPAISGITITLAQFGELPAGKSIKVTLFFVMHFYHRLNNKLLLLSLKSMIFIHLLGNQSKKSAIQDLTSYID